MPSFGEEVVLGESLVESTIANIWGKPAPQHVSDVYVVSLEALDTLTSMRMGSLSEVQLRLNFVSG